MLGRTRLYYGDPGHEPMLTPREGSLPVCPVCGEQAGTLVKNLWGEVAGCLECLHEVSAWEEAEGSGY